MTPVDGQDQGGAHRADPADPHPHSSNLGWPLVVLGVVLIGAVTAITISGNDVKGLNDTLGLLLGIIGGAGGVGAWVKAAQAAKQTDGVLDKRMANAVEEGITRALASSRPRPATRARPRPSVDDQAT